MRLVRKRAHMVLPYIIDKDVLQIGCVGMGKNDTYGGNEFTHGYLKPFCKSLTGLDINKSGVDFLNSKGFNCIAKSADEPFNLDKKFDVVLAEEVIEHLFDLKTFFINVKLHLKEDGELIILTPNPQALEYFIHKTISGRTWINKNHTFWSDVVTMEKLMLTFGFRLRKVDYADSFGENLRGKLFQLFFFWIPNRLARHTIYVAKKVV